MTARTATGNTHGTRRDALLQFLERRIEVEH